MLQFFLELTIALLAVYGAYTALHEIVALLEKLVRSRPNSQTRDPMNENRKEDSYGEAGESRRDDHLGGDN